MTGRSSILQPSNESGPGSGGGSCKFEEHDYAPFDVLSTVSPQESVYGGVTISPSTFRSLLVDILPMSLTLANLNASSVLDSTTAPPSSSIPQKLWNEWRTVVKNSLFDNQANPVTFKFKEIVRTTVWSVKYESACNNNAEKNNKTHLILTINGPESGWVVTTDTPTKLATVKKGERAKRASLEEDEHTRDEVREMATGIKATSNTKLTLFHLILLTRLTRFALASLKMRTISLRSAQTRPRQCSLARLAPSRK